MLLLCIVLTLCAVLATVAARLKVSSPRRHRLALSLEEAGVRWSAIPHAECHGGGTDGESDPF